MTRPVFLRSQVPVFVLTLSRIAATERKNERRFLLLPSFKREFPTGRVRWVRWGRARFDFGGRL